MTIYGILEGDHGVASGIEQVTSFSELPFPL